MMMRALTILGLMALMLAWAVRLTEAGHHCYLQAERGRHHELALEEFRWQGAVAQGRAIEINNVYGDVRAEAAVGTEVEVIATKRGLAARLAQASIEVTRRDGGVKLCLIHPDQDAHRPSRHFPNETQDQSLRESEVHVDFLVRVPPGVRFIARTVEGEIEAASLA